MRERAGRERGEGEGLVFGLEAKICTEVASFECDTLGACENALNTT